MESCLEMPDASVKKLEKAELQRLSALARRGPPLRMPSSLASLVPYLPKSRFFQPSIMSKKSFLGATVFLTNMSQLDRVRDHAVAESVSYTHLTLPTKA